MKLTFHHHTGKTLKLCWYETYTFYNYINTKFKLNHVSVQDNVPIVLKNQTFYLSFYEASIPNKHVNLGKVATDMVLAAKDYDPIFADNYGKRKDSWYIALKIEDSNFKNCLNKNHQNYNLVLKYLKRLKDEYLSTYVYEEIHFRKVKIEEFWYNIQLIMKGAYIKKDCI